MLKRTYVLWSAVVVAMLLSGCVPVPTQPAASSEGLLGQIKQRKQLIIATSADYPPYESVDKDGNFTGLDMDIIREVAKRMGVEAKIQDMGFDSLVASVQEKKVDVVIAAMQGTPERAEKVDFSIPYHMPKDGFLVAADSTLVINDPKDVAGKTIGVQTGTVQEKWVMNNLVTPGLTKEDQVFTYERVDDAARDLQNGRIEVLMILGEAAQSLADKMGLKMALLTDKTISAGQAIAMPKGETALKAEIDRIIGEMQSDGTIEKLQAAAGVP